MAVNNIFARAGVLAVKNCTGRSQLVQNLFWRNPKQQQGSNIDMNATVLGDPFFETDQRLQERSPAIDAGVPRVTWQDKAVQVVAPAEYRGDAPDLGAFEFTGRSYRLKDRPTGGDTHKNSSRKTAKENSSCREKKN